MESKKLHTTGLQLPVGKSAFILAVCFTMFLLFLLSTTGSNFLLNDHTLGPIPSQLLPVPGGDKNGDRNGGRRRRDQIQRRFKESGAGRRIAAAEGRWLTVLPVSNFTDSYLRLLERNGSSRCHHVSTATVNVVGLPPPSPAKKRPNSTVIRMAAGTVHRITLVSVGTNGTKRCFGGDYFETDLSSDHWKSRPPVTDNENGTYTIYLQVHPAFIGLYHFKIMLSFSNYHGLHRRPERWFRNQTVADVKIEFVVGGGGSEERAAAGPPMPKECRAADLRSLDTWAGRWTRGEYNRSCAMDGSGRYAGCMNVSEQCDGRRRWCHGPAGLLESNGWVYSAHCSFRIFGQDDAWQCLNKKWLFFWGDSNHVDTIRNLLNFVLGVETTPDTVRRRFDASFRRPSDANQSVRITNFFNGHANVSLNHEGLFSLSDPAYRSELASYLADDDGGPPDAVIMNSGLHDGMYWKYVENFAEEGVKAAAEFWAAAMGKGGGEEGRRRPRMIYRTTVAAAAWGRAAAFNPNKMEVYNLMMVEKLKEAGLIWGVVDGMDLTYPWHYDNNCSDGVHYGKPPAAAEWYGGFGHQYFVDLMLVHILLHAICAAPQ